MTIPTDALALEAERLALVALEAQMVDKFNPNHDRLGRFSSVPGGAALAPDRGAGVSGLRRGSTMPKLSPYLQQALDRFEAKIVDRKTEAIAVIADDGKTIYEDTMTGGTHEISIPPTVKVNGKVVTHNHPSGQSLSPLDIVTAMQTDVAEVRAVTPKYVYRFRLDRQQKLTPAVIRMIEAMSKDVTRRQVAQIMDGDITPEEADASHLHLLWTLFSEATGHLYAREERNG